MIGIVLVNYRSFRETVDYVSGELGKIESDCRIVIVNNSATEELDERLGSALDATVVHDVNRPVLEGQRVFVVSSAENLGYARGNNLGTEFLSRHFGIDWFLITNNDLRLRDPDVVEHLLARVAGRQDIGIVGPRIVCPRGTPQSPHRKMTLCSHVTCPCFLYPLFWVLRKFGMREETIADAPEGDYHRVMGSFMLVRAEPFGAVGGFDFNTFLYGEELILSERMRRAGYTTFFCPTRTVVHDHGTTIRKFQSERETQQLQWSSLLYYYEHYRGASKFGISLAKWGTRVHRNFYTPAIVFMRYVRARLNDLRTRKTKSVR